MSRRNLSSLWWLLKKVLISSCKGSDENFSLFVISILLFAKFLCVFGHVKKIFYDISSSGLRSVAGIDFFDAPITDDGSSYE